jgi:hypothetical protein
VSGSCANDLGTLRRRQQESLGLTPRTRLKSPREAEQFLEHAGVALRYAATAALPLASLRSATGPPADHAALVSSIELTNHLIGTSCGIEVNVVAGRLTLVHRSLVPALYRLVRRARARDDLSGSSLAARTAYALVKERRAVAAGDVRTRLGAPRRAKHDPAYGALGELQRLLLVDRGPFEIPASGIPYLSREGYPYRLFHEAHADLVSAAAKLAVPVAADTWLLGYLGAAVFASPRKLARLFRGFVSPAEIAGALDRLSGKGVLVVQKVSGETLAIRRE